MATARTTSTPCSSTSLVLPRIAFPLEDGVILALETDNRDMYKYTDTNGDGVSDKKELFYAGVGRVTNMEWQPSGLIWAMDNWMYMTYNPFRLRLAPGGKVAARGDRVERRPVGRLAGQLRQGVVHRRRRRDSGPVNFQTPIVYGAFNLPDNFEPDFRVPWPAPGGIADMQGGMRRVRAARRHAEQLHRRVGLRDLPRSSAAADMVRRLVLHRAGRAHRAPRRRSSSPTG